LTRASSTRPDLLEHDVHGGRPESGAEVGEALTVAGLSVTPRRLRMNATALPPSMSRPELSCRPAGIKSSTGLLRENSFFGVNVSWSSAAL
jgi:hypothetical protein